MSTLIGIDLNDGVMPDAAVQNGAKGQADIIKILAGRSRLMSELTTGNIVAGQTPCIGGKRFGMLGSVQHDHSGSVSRPLLHTINLWRFGATPPSNVGPSQAGNGPAVAISSSADGTLYVGTLFTSFVPMSSLTDGVYMNADFGVQVKTDATADIAVDVESAGGVTSFTETIASGVLRHVLASAHNKAIPLRPGRYNKIKVTITASCSSGTPTVTLYAFGLHQRRSATICMP